MAVRKTYPAKVIGGAEINAIIQNEEFFEKGRMFAHVRLSKGDAVDWHIHTGEIEYYYILSGTGIFTNSDKTEQTVSGGDVCTMEVGGGHAIRQAGDDILEFIALIINT
jgi:mannose-6-phosphate isomerase-like protein (cupin superfamily)